MTNIEILDTAIEAKFLLDSLPIWPSEVRLSNYYDSEFLVHAGIEQLAESVGAEIMTIERDDLEFPIKKSFEYQGVTFMQIGAKGDFVAALAHVEISHG